MAGFAGKTRIGVDTAALADGDSIAAYLVAAGTQLTATATSLNVNVTGSTLPTGAASETTLAALLAELQATNYADGAVWAAGSLGVSTLSVRKDAAGPLAGVVDGDWSPLQVNANGELKTSATVDFSGDYAEDAVHATGDIGLFSLSVRNDNQATTFTTASGDYAPFATDQKGALYTKTIHAAGNLQQVVTVGNLAAVALPAAPLVNRGSMFIQMLSGGQLYLGSATVTNSGITRGLQLGTGGYVSLDVAPGNLVYGIANAAGKEVVVWEFA